MIPHSGGIIFFRLRKWRINQGPNLHTASSFGNSPRLFDTLRNVMFSDSMDRCTLGRVIPAPALK